MATAIPLKKNTPRTNVTIAKNDFELPSPFVEGHQLRAVEADALNTQYHSAIRNQVAGTVKELADAGKDHAEIQKAVNEFIAEFDFGQSGGRSRNPVETQALDIARELVRDAVRAKGINLADVSGKQITEKAREVLADPAKGEKIRARAREMVEQRSNLDVSIDI